MKPEDLLLLCRNHHVYVPCVFASGLQWTCPAHSRYVAAHVAPPSSFSKGGSNSVRVHFGPDDVFRSLETDVFTNCNHAVM